jgi:hypothetical protein
MFLLSKIQIFLSVLQQQFNAALNEDDNEVPAKIVAGIFGYASPEENRMDSIDFMCFSGSIIPSDEKRAFIPTSASTTASESAIPASSQSKEEDEEDEKEEDQEEDEKYPDHKDGHVCVYDESSEKRDFDKHCQKIEGLLIPFRVTSSTSTLEPRAKFHTHLNGK